MIANDLNFLDTQIQTQKKTIESEFYSNLLISVSSTQTRSKNLPSNNFKTNNNSLKENFQKKFVPKLLPKKSNIIPSPLILSSSNYKNYNKKYFTRNQKIPLISLEEKAKTSFNEEYEEDCNNISIISNSSKNSFEFSNDDDCESFEKYRKNLCKNNIKNSIGSSDDTSCDSEQNKKIIMEGLQINSNDNNNKFDNDNNNYGKITILSILEKINSEKILKKNNNDFIL